MGINRRKFIVNTLLVSGLLFLLYYLFNWLVQQKALSLLDESIPDHIELSYDNLDISTIQRSVLFKNVTLVYKDELSHGQLGYISIKELGIRRFGLFDYLFNKTLSSQNIHVFDGEVHLKLKTTDDNDRANADAPLGIHKAHVKALSLRDISLSLRHAETDSLLAAFHDVDLEINNLEGRILPDDFELAYDEFSIKTDSVIVDLGPLNILKMQSIEGTNENTTISNTSIKSKYALKTHNQFA